MQSDVPGSSRLKRGIGLFGATALGLGALSCIGFIIFLSPASWAIGCIGLTICGAWFFSRSKAI
jgi:hypothetical protein